VVNLLDTSALLWTLKAPDRLSEAAREAIAAGDPVLSVASYWGVVIKAKKGLLPIPDPVSWWTRAAGLLGGRVLPIRASLPRGEWVVAAGGGSDFVELRTRTLQPFL
jgi:PIN domain nuclease of toxin-antitoxin system